MATPLHEMNRSLILPLLIIAFTLTDTLTTVFALNFLGGVELNPVYHLVGSGVFWAFKWIGALLLAVSTWWGISAGRPEWRIIAAVGAMIPALASLSNAIDMAMWSWGF